MADRRKAELEEKRAKVAELRRARDERKALLAQSADKPSEVSGTGQSNPSS
jgi:dynein intermediate chain